jgi:hypothetical protein
LQHRLQLTTQQQQQQQQHALHGTLPQQGEGVCKCRAPWLTTQQLQQQQRLAVVLTHQLE